MKQIILFFAILGAVALNGQALEVVESTDEVISYEDSLFLIKTTQITTTNIEGINDTSITYAGPLDTADLVNNLHTGYLNETNSTTARWRRALPFRKILTNYIQEKAFYGTLGYDLDSLNVSRYGAAYKGLYRVIRDNGTSFFVEVDNHPTLPTILRATGTSGEGNFNMLIYGRYFFRITIDGTAHYLLWDGTSSTRPVFRRETWGLPGALVTHDNTRMTKIR